MSGAEVRELRSLAGLSQEALGNRLHISRTYVSMIERDKAPIKRWQRELLATLALDATRTRAV